MHRHYAVRYIERRYHLVSYKVLYKAQTARYATGVGLAIFFLRYLKVLRNNFFKFSLHFFGHLSMPANLTLSRSNALGSTPSNGSEVTERVPEEPLRFAFWRLLLWLSTLDLLRPPPTRFFSADIRLFRALINILFDIETATLPSRYPSV